MRNLMLVLVGVAACGGASTSPPMDAGLDAVGDATAFPACGPSELPAPCGPSVVTAPTGYGADGPHPVVVDSIPNPHPTAPGPVQVYRPADLGTAPVILYSHAFGATQAVAYDTLFRHVASTGLAIIYVPYPTLPQVEADVEDRYTCLWQGFLTAIAQEGAAFDLTRMGFVGHSFGGGATPEMARRALVEHGWGSAGAFMMILAPWYSWGTAYDTLPVTLRTVIEVYADDEFNDHQIAVRDIWDKLPAGMDKGWLLLRTDTSCEASCGLNAPHTVPMTGMSANMNPQAVLNGYDAWGLWRRLDALAAYAFTGAAGARDVAYGVDPDMGTWTSCARPVRPLEAAATPITTTCVTPTFTLAARCEYADPDVSCP